MADNVSIEAANAVTVPVASDEISGVQFQRIKLTQGPDGTATDVTSTAPLAVVSLTATGAPTKFVSISTASSGDNTLVAAVTAKKIKVLSYLVVSAGAVTVRFFSGAAGTALTGAMSLITGTPATIVAPVSAAHLLETAVNTALVLNLGGNIQVSGHLSYIEEA